MSPSGQCAAGYEGAGVGACSWFTNYTFISGEPTLPEEMRSWTDIVIGGFHVDYTKTNPWRAPGSAPIYSPCGVAGGNPQGCPVGEGEIGDNCPGGGFAYGPDAVNVDFQVGYKQQILKNFIQLNLQDVQTTEWRAGGVAEVGWGIVANHGGGYSYRLCPKPTNENDVVTEDCFQQTPLK